MPPSPNSAINGTVTGVGNTNRICANYVKLWPRALFDRPADTRKGSLLRSVDILEKPGVYILYRDETPYYIGRAVNLRKRLWQHANRPNDRYYNFWNYFSAFVIESDAVDEIEGILIAAMPTANSASPKLPGERIPKAVAKAMHEIRQSSANH